MPITDVARQARALPIKQAILNDFSLGLNIRDEALGGDPRHLIQATNCDLLGGGARARWGTAQSSFTPGFIIDFLYYSPTMALFFAMGESGSKLAKTTNPFTAWTDVSTGAPSLSGADFVEFNGVLVFSTSAGVYTFDPNTSAWTLRNATVTGTSIAAWQNKLWVTGITSRVWRSAAGDYTSWDTTNDWADVREGSSDAPNLGLHVTQELDVQGRASLLVYKKGSLHRINSATTGQYTTLSSETGPIHKRAIVSNGSQTCFIAGDGIYVTNGVSSPVKVTDRVRPLFLWNGVSNPINVQPQPVWHRGRFLFSFPGYNPYAGGVSQLATMHLAWDPDRDTLTIDQFPCLGTSGADTVRASLSVKSTAYTGNLYYSDNNQQLFRMYDSAAADDAGTANKAVLQTPYLELAGGMRFRIHRVRVDATFATLSGGTPFTLRVRKDGSQTDTLTRTLTSGQTSPPTLQAYDFNRLGDCRSVSFIFELPIVAGVTMAAGYNSYVGTAQKQANEINRVLIEYTPTGRN